MAETNSLDISCPPSTKKPRLDSTASEGSEVLSQFLNDLDNLPDLSSLEGLGGNEANALPANTATNPPLPNAVSLNPNHQTGPNISPSATPPVSSQPPYTSLSQPTLNSSTTISMYSNNSPRQADVNTSLYSGYNATSVNAPSPQPVSVSTLADATPPLPSVSSSSAHGGLMNASPGQMHNFENRGHVQQMPASMIQQPSMSQRGGAPMPPGMQTRYSGQGMQPSMHPGMHVNQSHMMQHRANMIGRSMPHGMERSGMMPGMHPQHPQYSHRPQQYYPVPQQIHSRVMIPQQPRRPMHPGMPPQHRSMPQRPTAPMYGHPAQGQMPDNRFPIEQNPQAHPNLTHNSVRQSPGPVPSNLSLAAGGAAAQPGPGSQPLQVPNDTSFNTQPNQSAVVNPASVSQGQAIVRPQQTTPPNTAIGTAGPVNAIPTNNIQQGINSNVEDNSLPSVPSQPPSVSPGLNQPLGNRVPTPPPPGSTSNNLFPGPNRMQPGAPPNQTSDPEKRKQIQQQLVLLLHAHKCQRRERDQQASGDYRPCALPHCKTMKSVLNHMTECQAGRSCTYAHCATSRQIINHWRNCTRPDCPVCLPLKNPQPQKIHAGLPPDPMIPGGGGQMALPNTGMLNQPRSSIGGPGMIPGGGAGGIIERQMFSGGGYPNPSAGPGMGGAPSACHLPIPPIVSNPTQHWHSQVLPDLRQHLVRKLVEAIYPVQDPNALRDNRVKSLIQYAMKVEKVMFEAAQSRDEYYKLLAQKIYLIRKELDDRKKNKMPNGEPSQGYPNQPPTAQPGVYQMPPTPNSNQGNPAHSPHPNSELATGFPPTPHHSIEVKKEPGKMLSPNDPSAPIGSIPSLPGSGNDILSPPFPPSSIPGQPLNIKTEPNASIESIPLPDNLPSVPAVPTPSVPSVKPPESFKRRESLSEVGPPSIKPATPMTPRPAAVAGKIQPDPALRKVFTPEELEEALRPVFIAVWSQETESFPFQSPVDPDRLGIPDYFSVVKTPMDLSTISNRLSNGEYRTGWEFCSDMWLMFDNAWLYNKKASRVYKFCSKLSEVFDQYIDNAMKSLGYCCGMRYTYHPQVLYCYGKPLCTIPRDSPYYGCQNRYIYCPKCFHEIQGDTVTVGDDPLSATRLPKSHFKEMKNNAIDREPFVECLHCGREMHQICVLHHEQIWPGGFQCDTCLAALGKRKKDNKFVPRRLPSTKLSSYLETRINTILTGEDSGAGHVTIRVVSSSDKTLETRPLMRDRFSGDFPAQFPYRTKAMFVFEEIDGVDVCFFGMHVQEYGSDCLAPNTRRVYISYLDSVHFFKPRMYRTKVYHEILIGYLDFCKANGFMTAHIWACPPSEGDDYIFHCHPLEQKIPKPKRLSDWYRKMLDTAKEMNVIYDYKDIFKYFTDEGVTMVTELPYFEGDFWPNVLEEFIKELDQEAKEREATELALSTEGSKKAGKRGSSKKGSKKAGGPRKASKKGVVLLGGDDLSSKVYQTMEKHKDVFFTVLLQPPCSGSSPLPGTADPDQLIACDLMDGRDAFLTMSRERHWEFSSLRRAKFSSISMVFELHTQSEDKFMYNCNSCHLDVVARYHCVECDDFDLCIKCYKEVGHHHPMVKQGLDIDDPQSNDSKPLDPQKARQASIEKCIRALVHATQCRDPHCKQPSCIKMKKVLTHTKECKLMIMRKWNQCNTCKQFVLLCISHAKSCPDNACRVPLCATMKKNLKEQKKQRAVNTNRFTQLRAERMAQMLKTNGSSSGNASSPQQSSSTHVSPQNSTGKNPTPAVPSPGPRSVGKGGPKTPGTPGGKGRMNPATPGGGMAANPGGINLSAAKPEPNMPTVPPNMTAPRMEGEMTIKKVLGVTPEQIMVMLRDPSKRESAQQYLNSNPEMKNRVHMMIRQPSYTPNQIPGNPMYNQQRPAGIQYQNYGHQQQGMMRYPQGQYHPMNPRPQMPQANYTPRPTYPNTQQNPTTLQRMLTSGTPQQYVPQQPSYNPQINTHHLGPPPQYPTGLRQQAPQQHMPQTAGYPQVLGQQARPMHAPSHMGQMHGQYGSANQGMGMEHMGMQSDNFMYQQGQPHQYSALNSSNNNNNYQGEMLSALPPQDRLSRFVENL